MLETDGTAVVTALEAARQRNLWWGLWAYDREVDKLVLQLPGPYRGFWRSNPDALLVSRSPRYVRLESAIAGIELTTATRAVELMEHPPPACVVTEESTVALYVDCPTTMHHAQFRMATPQEREALRTQLSSYLADRFDRDGSQDNVAMAPREGLVTIECDEGVFLIWAGVLFLSWRDRVDFSGFV